MEHTAKGEHKLLERCSLPLTGAGVVQRIITDLGVLDVTPTGFEVIELADGVSREQIIEQTGASVRFAAHVN